MNEIEDFWCSSSKVLNQFPLPDVWKVFSTLKPISKTWFPSKMCQKSLNFFVRPSKIHSASLQIKIIKKIQKSKGKFIDTSRKKSCQSHKFTVKNLAKREWEKHKEKRFNPLFGSSMTYTKKLWKFLQTKKIYTLYI